jgi:hypothetical protein
MTLDLLLAVGILLPTASQLWPSAAPVGPGEACLVIWIALMIGRQMVELGIQFTFTPALSRLVIFWLLFAVAQSIGTLTGIAIGHVHDTSLFMHDVLAYPLLAAISVLCVVGPDTGPRMHRVAWFLVRVGSTVLALQIAQAWGFVGAGSLDPWYWDRLHGWSENPNQLALRCALLGLLSLHLADVAASTLARIAAIGTAVLPIYVRRLTKGDAFSLVLVAAGPIFIALKATFLLTSRARLDGLTTLLCGLTIFSIFHLIIRYPIFWFAIALRLVAAQDSKASLMRRWS